MKELQANILSGQMNQIIEENQDFNEFFQNNKELRLPCLNFTITQSKEMRNQTHGSAEIKDWVKIFVEYKTALIAEAKRVETEEKRTVQAARDKAEKKAEEKEKTEKKKPALAEREKAAEEEKIALAERKKKEEEKKELSIDEILKNSLNNSLNLDQDENFDLNSTLLVPKWGARIEIEENQKKQQEANAAISIGNICAEYSVNNLNKSSLMTELLGSDKVNEGLRKNFSTSAGFNSTAEEFSRLLDFVYKGERTDFLRFAEQWIEVSAYEVKATNSYSRRANLKYVDTIKKNIQDAVADLSDTTKDKQHVRLTYLIKSSKIETKTTRHSGLDAKKDENPEAKKDHASRVEFKSKLHKILHKDNEENKKDAGVKKLLKDVDAFGFIHSLNAWEGQRSFIKRYTLTGHKRTKTHAALMEAANLFLKNRNKSAFFNKLNRILSTELLDRESTLAGIVCDFMEHAFKDANLGVDKALHKYKLLCYQEKLIYSPTREPQVKRLLADNPDVAAVKADIEREYQEAGKENFSESELYRLILEGEKLKPVDLIKSPSEQAKGIYRSIFGVSNYSLEVLVNSVEIGSCNQDAKLLFKVKDRFDEHSGEMFWNDFPIRFSKITDSTVLRELIEVFYFEVDKRIKEGVDITDFVPVIDWLNSVYQQKSGQNSEANKKLIFGHYCERVLNYLSSNELDFDRIYTFFTDKKYSVARKFLRIGLEQKDLEKIKESAYKALALEASKEIEQLTVPFEENALIELNKKLLKLEAMLQNSDDSEFKFKVEIADIDSKIINKLLGKTVDHFNRLLTSPEEMIKLQNVNFNILGKLLNSTSGLVDILKNVVDEAFDGFYLSFFADRHDDVKSIIEGNFKKLLIDGKYDKVFDLFNLDPLLTLGTYTLTKKIMEEIVIEFVKAIEHKKEVVAKNKLEKILLEVFDSQPEAQKKIEIAYKSQSLSEEIQKIKNIEKLKGEVERGLVNLNTLQKEISQVEKFLNFFEGSRSEISSSEEDLLVSNNKELFKEYRRFLNACSRQYGHNLVLVVCADLPKNPSFTEPTLIKLENQSGKPSFYLYNISIDSDSFDASANNKPYEENGYLRLPEESIETLKKPLEEELEAVFKEINGKLSYVTKTIPLSYTSNPLIFSHITTNFQNYEIKHDFDFAESNDICTINQEIMRLQKLKEVINWEHGLKMDSVHSFDIVSRVKREFSSQVEFIVRLADELNDKESLNKEVVEKVISEISNMLLSSINEKLQKEKSLVDNTVFSPEEQTYRCLSVYSAYLRLCIEKFEDTPEGKRYVNYLDVLDLLLGNKSIHAEKTADFNLSTDFISSLDESQKKILREALESQYKNALEMAYKTDKNTVSNILGFMKSLNTGIGAGLDNSKLERQLTYVRLRDLLLNDGYWKNDSNPFETLGFGGENREADFAKILDNFDQDQKAALKSALQKRHEKLLEKYKEVRTGEGRKPENGKTPYFVANQNVISAPSWRFLGLLNKNIDVAFDHENLVYRAMNAIRKLTAPENMQSNFQTMPRDQLRKWFESALGLIMAHGDEKHLEECEFRLRALFYRHFVMKTEDKSNTNLGLHTRELINIMMQQLPFERSKQYKPLKDKMDFFPVDLSDSDYSKTPKVAEEYLQVFEQIDLVLKELIDLTLKIIDKKKSPIEEKRIRKQLYLWRHSVLKQDNKFKPEISNEIKKIFQPLVSSLSKIQFGVINVTSAKEKLKTIKDGFVKTKCAFVKALLHLGSSELIEFIMQLDKVEIERKRKFLDVVNTSGARSEFDLKLNSIFEEIYNRDSEKSLNILREDYVLRLRNFQYTIITMNLKERYIVEVEGLAALKSLNGLVQEIQEGSLTIDDVGPTVIQQIVKIETASGSTSRLELGLLQTLADIVGSKEKNLETLRSFIFKQFNDDPQLINEMYIDEVFKSRLMDREINLIFIDGFSGIEQVKNTLRKMMDADPIVKKYILEQVEKLKKEVGSKKDCYGALLLETMSQIKSEENLAAFAQGLEILNKSPGDEEAFNKLAESIFLLKEPEVDSYCCLEMGKILLQFVESPEKDSGVELQTIKNGIEKIFGGKVGLQYFCMGAILDQSRMNRSIEDVLKTHDKTTINEHFNLAKRLYDDIDKNLNNDLLSESDRLMKSWGPFMCAKKNMSSITDFSEYGTKLLETISRKPSSLKLPLPTKLPPPVPNMKPDNQNCGGARNQTSSQGSNQNISRFTLNKI